MQDKVPPARLHYPRKTGMGTFALDGPGTGVADKKDVRVALCPGIRQLTGHSARETGLVIREHSLPA